MMEARKDFTRKRGVTEGMRQAGTLPAPPARAIDPLVTEARRLTNEQRRLAIAAKNADPTPKDQTNHVYRVWAAEANQLAMVGKIPPKWNEWRDSPAAKAERDRFLADWRQAQGRDPVTGQKAGAAPAAGETTTVIDGKTYTLRNGTWYEQ